MQRFNGASRQPYVIHIMRTNAHIHTGLTRALCGYTALEYTTAAKPLRTNAMPCRSCRRLAKPGENC